MNQNPDIYTYIFKIAIILILKAKCNLFLMVL
jgi:hypothetical protein